MRLNVMLNVLKAKKIFRNDIDFAQSCTVCLTPASYGGMYTFLLQVSESTYGMKLKLTPAMFLDKIMAFFCAFYKA